MVSAEPSLAMCASVVETTCKNTDHSMARIPSHSEGFALILVLSILALLLVLVVTFSAVLNVEIRSSGNSKDVLEARQNALLGLQMAIGQLQEKAGKDQAVTFPATTFYPTKNINLTSASAPRQGKGDIFDDTTFGYRKFATTSKSRSYLSKVGTYLIPSERIAWDNALKTWWKTRNPHWTGIMDSALRVDRATDPNSNPVPLAAQRYETTPDTKYGEPKRAQLPIWLVSGNEKFHINQESDTAYPPGYQTPDMELPDPSSDSTVVFLVGEGSATDLDAGDTDQIASPDGYDGRVKVRKQDVAIIKPDGSTEPRGHYAYWVGDESIKANFSIRDPYANDDMSPLPGKGQGTEDYRNRLQAPQRIGWDNMTGFDLATFAKNDKRLENISTSKEISLLENTKVQEVRNATKSDFHNLTAFSKSLITDTALGGLKKDLTVFLQGGSSPNTSAPVADTARYNTGDPRFGAWGGTNSGFPKSTNDIPTWGQIRNWYSNEATSGSITPDANTAPVITYIMMHAGLSYDGATKKIRWHFLPAIVLWNPYNVGLKSATYDLELRYSPKLWNFFVASESPSLAELQQATDGNWTGNPGDKSTWKFTGTDNIQHSIDLRPPDTVDMTGGPWTKDSNLTDGTSDAFGRLYYSLSAASSGSKTSNFPLPAGSSLKGKNFEFRYNPFNSTDNATDPTTGYLTNSVVPLKFRFTASFGVGESRIFTVGSASDSASWDRSSPVTLKNDFDPDAPGSFYFDAVNIANGPANAGNLRFVFSLLASTNPITAGITPTVKFQIGSQIIEESKGPLGAISSMDTAIHGDPLCQYTSYEGLYDSGDQNGNTVSNMQEPWPKFVSSWRKLYDTSDFSNHLKTGDGLGDPVSLSSVPSSYPIKNDSSIFSFGQVYLDPFTGSGDQGPESTHNYFSAFGRFNLGAKSFDYHPRVDRVRSQDGENNKNLGGKIEGLGRLNFFKASSGWGEKWNQSQSSGNLAYSLINYRNLPTSTYSAFSGLPIRNARRAGSEILSLGQLQQINLSPYIWEPTFPVGNSDAAPYTDREAIAGLNSRPMGSTTGSLGKLGNDADNTLLDLSYLLNENLWDRYFLSTIQQSAGLDLAKPFPNSRIRFWDGQAVVNGTIPASNVKNFDSAAAYLFNFGALNVNSTSVEAWKALLTAFRDLSLTSQSNESNSAKTVPVSRSLDPALGPVGFTFGKTFGTDGSTSATTYGNVSAAKDYSRLVGGFRFLTDAMVQILAERIVDEIRMRGPFLSLSDFVNRRLVAPEGSGTSGSNWYDARTNGLVGLGLKGGAESAETGNSGDEDNGFDFLSPSYDPFIGLQGINGALQRAINVSGINGGVNHPAYYGAGWSLNNDRVFGVRIKNAGSDDYLPTSSHFTAAGVTSNTDKHHSLEPAMRSHLDTEHLAGAPAGEAGQLFAGAPGFVTQGDILAMIGSALTPRGDTFVIRAYGDSVSKSGNIKSRVWLEAIVQRMPAPLKPDATDKWRYTDSFGRKFEIVKLRWLSPEDI